MSALASVVAEVNRAGAGVNIDQALWIFSRQAFGFLVDLPAVAFVLIAGHPAHEPSAQLRAVRDGAMSGVVAQVARATHVANDGLAAAVVMSATFDAKLSASRRRGDAGVRDGLIGDDVGIQGLQQQRVVRRDVLREQVLQGRTVLP